LQELIKIEDSFITYDNLSLYDLSEGNLATLKSPLKHHGISYKDIKVVNSSYKSTRKVSSFNPNQTSYEVVSHKPQLTANKKEKTLVGSQ